jgi:serine/threonine-protein kinase
MGSVTDPPARFGRYEVVGRLALGGMAEVLLARLVGPSGFERATVIKRILPQYATYPPFRDMFLDEARIASGIRHPNVVQHYELGEQGEELYLVMEYLEGEALGSVQRRSRTRGLHLPVDVVAYIVAEACAGLHAAHELVDADDVRQEVVHRDISPHNIFVTYDGTIKLIDFGIAKAADRATKTETGVLKGKFEYMSPEQARGEPVDRRADVFSMGVVLYELLTEARPFRRATVAATIAAIDAGDVVPPRELAPSCPPALEATCMRALSSRPGDRHGSALDMRRELLAQTTVEAANGLPEERLAATMTRLFAERIEEKREMLRSLRARSHISHVPEADVDLDAELDHAPAPPRRRPEGNRARRWMLYGGAFAVAALAIGVALALPGGEPRALSEAAAARAPHAATERREAPAPAAPERDRVRVAVTSEPAGARIVRDGVSIGTTPATLELPRSGDGVVVTLELEGRPEQTFTVPTDRDGTIHRELAPPDTAGRRRPPRSPARRPPAKREKAPDDWSEVRF